ncbi:Vesicle-fusing ATPase [Glycine soja]
MSVHATGNIFKQKEFNLESLGIGIKHVKGMLLYGPPRTGKTLMAEIENSFLAADVNLQELDNLTKQVEEENIKVTMDDFLNALHEVTSALGASTDDLERCRLHDIVECGNQNLASLLSFLISAKSMIGLHESTKCAQIIKIIGVCAHWSSIFKLDFSNTTCFAQTVSSEGLYSSSFFPKVCIHPRSFSSFLKHIGYKFKSRTNRNRSGFSGCVKIYCHATLLCQWANQNLSYDFQTEADLLILKLLSWLQEQILNSNCRC